MHILYNVVGANIPFSRLDPTTLTQLKAFSQTKLNALFSILAYSRVDPWQGEVPYFAQHWYTPNARCSRYGVVNTTLRKLNKFKTPPAWEMQRPYFCGFYGKSECYFFSDIYVSPSLSIITPTMPLNMYKYVLCPILHPSGILELLSQSWRI